MRTILVWGILACSLVASVASTQGIIHDVDPFNNLPPEEQDRIIKERFKVLDQKLAEVQKIIQETKELRRLREQLQQEMHSSDGDCLALDLVLADIGQIKKELAAIPTDDPRHAARQEKLSLYEHVHKEESKNVSCKK